jgi:hypothetical protein
MLGVGLKNDAEALRATGTDGHTELGKSGRKPITKVPTVVPRGAKNGAVEAASNALRLAPDCTDEAEEEDDKNGDGAFALTRDNARTICTKGGDVASSCTDEKRGRKQVSPTASRAVSRAAPAAAMVAQSSCRRWAGKAHRDLGVSRYFDQSRVTIRTWLLP